MNDPIIVYLADKRNRFDECGWYRFDCLCASLKTVALFLPPLPILIFHEDFQEQDKERIRAIVPNVTFEQIDFGGHEEFYACLRPHTRVGQYCYCMMCRFFSGPMQAHPLVACHSHYMRLDDDCYFVAPVAQRLLEHTLVKDYTYCVTFEEHRRDLYDFTVDFMEREKLSLKDVPKYTSGGSPYTNFHVSSLTLWRHPIVVRYLDAIEAVHGCVAKGWTDSSIQYMIIKLLGPEIGLDVHYWERAIPYRHNQHCAHSGPHTKYCRDGKNDTYPWGPPLCLMK